MGILTGCSLGSSEQDPYAAEWSRAHEEATSDFEKAVLKDGKITKAEYEEAVQRLVSCALTRGVTIVPEDVGGHYIYEVQTESASEADSVYFDCSVGTKIVIEPIYTALVTNPNNVDQQELEFDCLTRKGLIPPDYSLQEYKSDWQSDNKKFPFDDTDPAFSACMYNPSN